MGVSLLLLALLTKGEYITRTIATYNTKVTFVMNGQLDTYKLDGEIGKKGSKETPYFYLRK